MFPGHFPLSGVEMMSTMFRTFALSTLT